MRKRVAEVVFEDGCCGEVSRDHDHTYVRAINKLIPSAEAFADATVGAITKGASVEQENKWSRVFHRRMNQLAEKSGLRRSVKSVEN